TFPSVGYMVSGIEYDHSPDHHEWFQKVYHENQTLSVLHDHGYNIHFYGENYYTYANANELPNYIENSVETERETLKSIVRKPFQFGWQFTKMALFRCFPFLLKAPVGGISSDTCNEYISYTSDELQGFEAYAYDMKTAYGYIKKHDGNFQFKGEKNFSFIHISGCHNTKYDENWKKRKNLEDHADKVQVSAKLSMAVVNKYIENMKAMGIYENSTIVIVGDHGKVGGGLANAQSSRMKDLKKPMRTALYVKPAGVTKSDFANGKMQTSNAPVSHENLWATIFQSENISYGESVDFAQKSVFDIESEFNGDYTNFARKFYWTKRHPSMNSYELVSYEIVGDSSVWESWKITDRKKYNHKLFHN
ncbi:MAG: hypothetical protein IIX01_05745, partial [Clostridia bacterium]|nr:hypothetical protein [Clostridia bacterium]